MAITGGTTNGAVTADLVLNKQRIETKLREFTFLETVTLASQAAGTIGVGFIPKGARIQEIGFNASATLGASATIAVGITGATGKYRAAATYTTADAWTWFALNAAVGVVLTADEEILLTTAVAALPSSGTLRVAIKYLLP